MWLLRTTRSLLRGFQWARDAADRLVRVVLPHMHYVMPSRTRGIIIDIKSWRAES